MKLDKVSSCFSNFVRYPQVFEISSTTLILLGLFLFLYLFQLALSLFFFFVSLPSLFTSSSSSSFSLSLCSFTVLLLLLLHPFLFFFLLLLGPFEGCDFLSVCVCICVFVSIAVWPLICPSFLCSAVVRWLVRLLSSQRHCSVALLHFSGISVYVLVRCLAVSFLCPSRRFHLPPPLHLAASISLAAFLPFRQVRPLRPTLYIHNYSHSQLHLHIHTQLCFQNQTLVFLDRTPLFVL